MTDLYNSGVGEFLALLAMLGIIMIVENRIPMLVGKQYVNNTTDIILNGDIKRRVEG